MGIARDNEVDWEGFAHGDRFVGRRKRLTEAAGGDQLGCSVYEVPPGCTAFPFHLHHANEEAIYILEGRGTLRLADGEHVVGAGDYIALKAGKKGAHQLVNTFRKPLRYLCFSTMTGPDVTEYPDSNKVGILFGLARKSRRVYMRNGKEVDYWDGEV
ncbi:MAG: cupin domain-containing protein [Gammaproteobacteria bacterium]|jgi:uncharacterized cupin superfamily protein